MRLLARLFAGIALLGLVLSMFVEASFRARSQPVQLVRRDAVTGAIKPFGPTVELVDVPNSAVVSSGGNGVAALVDADRMDAAGAALRLSDVTRFLNIARVGSLLTIVLALVVSRLAARLKTLSED